MSVHRNAYLDALGIIRWQRKSLATQAPVQTSTKLLFIGEQELENKALSAGQKNLIERMLSALNWSKQSCQLSVLPLNNAKERFQKKLKQTKATQVLVFGFELAESLDFSLTENPFTVTNEQQQVFIAVVASVNQLEQDKTAKKASWEIMQSLLKVYSSSSSNSSSSSA